MLINSKLTTVVTTANMSLLLPLFFTFFCFLYFYFTRTFNYWNRKNVKGPKPIPLFGNFKEVFLRRKHVGVLYSELYKKYPEEKVVGLYRMTSPTLLIRDLDIVKQVLIKDFESFPDRGLYYSKKRLGDNLFHSSVEVSKILRKHFTSVFTASKFKSNFHILVDRVDKFLDYLGNCTKELEYDVLRVFRKYAVDSIMFASFGIDVDAYNDNNDLCDIMDAAIQTPSYFLEMELLFPGSLSKYNLSIFPDKVTKFCQQIVQAGVSLDIPKNVRNSLMDVLMNLRQEGDVGTSGRSDNEKEIWMNITDDVLTGQVFIFYFAGYGNNSLLSTYALYHLAKNPEVQEKLIEEIDSIFEKYDGNFTYEALKEMKYLQMVFHETLRMHPLTNSISRNVGRDIKLEGTDFVINKNTILAISPYSIQHDEKYYPEPEKFNPERFSPEMVAQRHPCAMLSFGQGPRSCFGSRFAHIQFGICIAKFLSKYRVESSKNTVENISYTPMRLLLTPNERIYLRLVPRDR